MYPVVAVIGGAVARILTVESAKFIATRTLLITLFWVLLPIAIYKAFVLILKQILFVTSIYLIDHGIDAGLIQINGLAGWIAIQIKLPQALSMVLSAVSFRFILGRIRMF